MSIDQTPISRKLSIIVVLFAVPIAILAWLFIQTSLKDIQFAQKERSGVSYLNGIWPVLSTLIAASNDTTISPSGRLAGTPDLAALGKAHDADMDSAAAANEMSASLRALNWPTAQLARNAASEKAIAAARALLTKVADGSNLTLDPDLDSFYVMDAITTKLPEVLDRAGTLLALVRSQRAQAKLSDDDKAELMIQLGLFTSATSGTQGSLNSSYKGNPDGTVRTKLEAPARAFASATDKFSSTMKDIALALREDATRNKIDLTSVSGLYLEAAKSTDMLWRSTAAELDRLLATRSSGLSMRLWMMLGIAGAVFAAALAVTFTIARRIAASIAAITVAMGELAHGNKDTIVPGIGRKDEIGQMADALNVFKENALEQLRLADEFQTTVRERDARNQNMEGVIEGFRTTTSDLLSTVDQNATLMKKTASTLTSVADDASAQATSATAISGETATNVNTVAAASEQLASSIQEIGRQVERATSAVRAAAATTDRSAHEIEGLSAAGQRIGAVVDLIQAIAAQTNLLALNATIEAARAGEAGRGFAVVASEVKNLAAQTAKATEEIAQQVAGIQSSTKSAVDAVKEIASAMRQIDEVTTTIASAVEEQGAATREISQNVQLAATGTQALAGNISTVNAAIGEASEGASQVLVASEAVSGAAEKLSDEVERFFNVLRTGPMDRRKTDDPTRKGPERRAERRGSAADRAA